MSSPTSTDPGLGRPADSSTDPAAASPATGSTEVPAELPVDPELAALADPLIGHVLEGKYRIHSILGSGGMSLVYEAEHLGIGRRVAVKVLHRHCALHPELVERFEREARAAARIAHPNIVDVLDFGRLSNGIPFIVMELLEGQGLFERLGSSGAMPVARAIEIVLEVLAALDAAHRAGVYHRDIKPENIFLAKELDGSEIGKVVDFGIAKFAELGPGGPRLTTEGLAMGTPAYMPPEQATGSSDIDARSDLYSTGVLLYELLSHRLPHEGTLDATITKLLTEAPMPLQEVAPWVPKELAEVVHKTIARDREERYQTAQELIRALQPFANLPPIDVGPIPLFRRNSEPAKTIDEEIMRVPAFAALPRVEPAAARVRRRLSPAHVGLVALAALLIGGTLSILLPSDPVHERAARAESGRVSKATAARPVPTVPERASVTVSTNIAGARVLLDGNLLGTTPLDTTVVPKRDAQLLRVEAEGYEPAEYWVRTSSPVRVTVALDRHAENPAAAPEPAPPPRRPRKAGAPRLPFQKAY